jgi:hypothetical protein
MNSASVLSPQGLRRYCRARFANGAGDDARSQSRPRKMALAQAAAYRRGDLFEKRRRLMQNWSDYFDRPRLAGDVVPMRKGTGQNV